MKLTTFKSISRAYVHGVVDESWPVIAELLTTHIDADSKQLTPMFNFAEFKEVTDPTTIPGRRYHGHTETDEQGNRTWVRDISGEYDEIPNTVRRCKDNVVAINGIVLDIDENMTIEQAIETLSGIEFVLYTTFRHTKEKHKFRIVIPFSQPLLAEDIAGRQASIMATFPGVDNASFTVSQSFYFHSGKNDSQAYWIEGDIINPYDFEYIPPKQFVPRIINAEYSEPDAAYKAAVLTSLQSCQGLHYAGKGNDNKAVLTFISICRSIGLTFEEYDNICARIAHPDSQLVNANVRRDAWIGWQGDRVRRETRDAFIQAYNGVPVKVKFNPEEHARRYELYCQEQARKELNNDNN